MEGLGDNGRGKRQVKVWQCLIRGRVGSSEAGRASIRAGGREGTATVRSTGG